MNALKEIIVEFDASNLTWCCWKGLHKIPHAFDGLSDIDIYVPMRESQRPEKILMKNYWFQMEPLVTFDGVFHWYKWDSNINRFLHIHLYRIMRTGMTYSKSFVLDDTVILKNLEKDCNGVWIPAKEVSQYLHLLRVQLKSQGLLAKIFLLKERAKHKKEHAQLDGIGDLDLKESWEMFKPKKVYASSLISDTHSVLRRALGKIRSSKKRLIPAGAIISIVGSDGSGKSTLIPELQNACNEVFDNVSYNFGRPNFSLLLLPFWCIRAILPFARECLRIEKAKKATSVARQRNTSMLGVVYHTALAYERKLLMNRASKAKSTGHLVLIDRCPTTQVHQMDGPKITGSGVFLNWLARNEASLYSNLPKADLAIRLEVDLIDVLNRNEKRVKLFKESKEEIEDRFQKFQSYRPKASIEICIDARNPEKKVLKDTISVISQFLCQARR